MKKLISIGVALAILAAVAVPLGVAAQPPANCTASNFTYPTTFAKIPFAILQSGLELTGDILGPLASTLGLPTWLVDVVNTVAPWTGGPLSWTVDMLGWGLWMVSSILGPLASTLGLPTWLSSVVNTLVCGIFTPYTCVTGTPLALNCS